MARAIATGFAFLVLLAGCGAPKEPLPQLPPHARAGDITASSCTIKIGDAILRAECGTLVVAENRADPKSRLIALPYKRVLARSNGSAEPVFLLNGGPGQSNLASGGLDDWFLDRHDFVMLGFRGVDGSVQLDCPEVDKAIRRWGPFANRAGIALIADGYRRCATRLRREGVDLKGYTVLETVDDIEALRRALKYDRIDLLSISYGTRLAMIYGWRYPDAVQRSAMVSVNPPGHFRFDPARFDKQVDDYAALCGKAADCRSKTLAADIRKALAGMPKRWWGVPLNRDAVALATFTALYSTNAAPAVFDTWSAAARGDYSGIALVSAAYPFMLPRNMLWGDFAAKGSSADFDFESGAAAMRDLAPGRTLLGAPFNAIGWSARGAWPVQTIPAEYRRMQPSGIETLLVGGSLDVATPPELARDEVLPVFPHAHQVVLREYGHAGDLFYAQPKASRHLLARFFDTGAVDASAFRYRPVTFDPGWMSFPLIAKCLLAIVIAVLAGLALLVRWLIVRRLRKARV